MPVWLSVLPFGLMLLAIAILPSLAGAWWAHPRHRLWVVGCLATPVAMATQPSVLLHTAYEYAAFVSIMASLFIISSHILIRGSLPATPLTNTAFLAVGSLLASLIGTTGACMLLIRPLLRTNSCRQRTQHVFVFFIFLVANIGGLLTPLGDAPLFLGFLRGIPFFWTLRLLPVWSLGVASLLTVFYLWDKWAYKREAQVPSFPKASFQIVGTHNLVYFVALMGLIIANGAWHLPTGVQELGMLSLALLSWISSPKTLRQENNFSWAPLEEVSILFAGIFITMVPVLSLLNTQGAGLGIHAPWQFFWLTGGLSSFLDNAPTYLALTALASALVQTDAWALQHLLATPLGERLLTAISLGAVMMGANTYLGNGPNFMVKAVAESAGVRMPSFVGYMGYSALVLMPLFAGITWLFLR